MGRVILIGMLCLLTAADVRGDEAILRNGRRVPGRLALEEGRWSFLPAGRGEAIPGSELSEVRLDSSAVAPLHAALPMRVLLRNGQHLTGGLGEFSGKSVSLRTVAAGRISVPRAAVVGLRQPPGWMLLRADDFEEQPEGWKLEGRPRCKGSATSGERGLALDAAGQSAEFVLSEPIKEGRAAVSFRDSATEGNWLVEAEFQLERQTRIASVQFGGGKTYGATVSDMKGEAVPVARSDGWHRLVVQFSPTSLRIALDDAILWHELRRGPGGPLKRIRLLCRGESVRGQVVFDDFSLHRACDELRHPPGDPEQDEVWLKDGDQLFGQFVRADREGIVMEGRFGRRVLPWALTRGVFPRPPEKKAAPRDQVRVWLDSGFDSEPDRLDGFVQALDGRRLLLRHADLGEVSLARGHVLRIEWPGDDQR
jgi:hypothetical protein